MYLFFARLIILRLDVVFLLQIVKFKIYYLRTAEQRYFKFSTIKFRYVL